MAYYRLKINEDLKLDMMDELDGKQRDNITPLEKMTTSDRLGFGVSQMGVSRMQLSSGLGVLNPNSV